MQPRQSNCVDLLSTLLCVLVKTIACQKRIFYIERNSTISLFFFLFQNNGHHKRSFCQLGTCLPMPGALGKSLAGFAQLERCNGAVSGSRICPLDFSRFRLVYRRPEYVEPYQLEMDKSSLLMCAREGRFPIL